MDKQEYNTGRFHGTDEQATEVRTWRGRYEDLTASLGRLGTQVRVSRVLETDKDIAPYRFIRNANHEFVFPPQEVEVVEDKSEIIDATPGYALRSEDVTYGYDPSKVMGHVRVAYEDSDSCITFSVTDIKGDSDLPEEAVAEINQKMTPKPTNN